MLDSCCAWSNINCEHLYNNYEGTTAVTKSYTRTKIKKHIQRMFQVQIWWFLKICACMMARTLDNKTNWWQIETNECTIHVRTNSWHTRKPLHTRNQIDKTFKARTTRPKITELNAWPIWMYSRKIICRPKIVMTSQHAEQELNLMVEIYFLVWNLNLTYFLYWMGESKIRNLSTDCSTLESSLNGKII